MPTTASVAGNGRTPGSSHSTDTNQRPAESRDTVTVDGTAPSGSGRDQRMSSGSAIFASVSAPSRQRNADRVYSALARDFFRDLNRGNRARLAKKLPNAVCRCRNACCNGTDDTSPRNASSSVRFHPVSNADVAS